MNSYYSRSFIGFSISILSTFGYAPLGLSQTVIEFPSTIIKRSQTASPETISHNDSLSVKSHETLKIISIARQNENQLLTSDRSLTVKVKATPGVFASVLLIADKHTIRETPALEIAPGIYQATIDFDSNTHIVEGVIMARLQHGEQVIYDSAGIPFSVTKANPEGTCTLGGSQPSLFHQCDLNSLSSKVAVNNSSIPLAFTSHRNEEKVNGDNLVVIGKTQANAEVRIKVNSSFPLIGSFIQLEGDTLVNKTIKADKKGDFSFVIPSANRIVSGLKYTIDAIAILEDNASKPVKLTLLQN